MDTKINEDELVALGGNIELTGFNEVDSANMIVIKKMVGNYSHKLADSVKGFEKLKFILKVIHKKEKSEKYEIHAKVIVEGKLITSETTERNLYFAIDSVMKKIMHELGIK